MRAQITLTVNGSKRFIAKGVAALPEVRAALESGKILLKGGTTVSALAEELGLGPMRVSGRISGLGAKTSAVSAQESDAAHVLLVDRGIARDAYWSVVETVMTLDQGDVVVTGANAIDAHGGAAVMAGGVLGGNPGHGWVGMQIQGAQVIVAAGLEKLIPGCIGDAIGAAGQKRPDIAMGMAVGLMPIFGRIITEIEACLLLGAEKATVIGSGGIDGAEGAVTLLVQGEPEPIKQIFRLALKANKTPIPGSPMTLAECRPSVSASCPNHNTCVYYHPGLLKPL